MDPEIEIDLPEADIDPLIQEDLQDFSDLLEVDAAQEATQVQEQEQIRSDKQEAAELEDPREKGMWNAKAIIREGQSILTGGIQDTASSIATFPERTADVLSGERQQEIRETGEYTPEWDPFQSYSNPIITRTWWGKIARGVVHFGTMAAGIVAAVKASPVTIPAALKGVKGYSLIRAAGIGATSDLISQESDGHNALGMLRDRYGFIDTPISTRDTDHPIMMKLKNITEGMGIGLVFDGAFMLLGKGSKKARTFVNNRGESVDLNTLRKGIQEVRRNEFGFRGSKNKPQAEPWQGAHLSEDDPFVVWENQKRVHKEWGAEDGSAGNLITNIQKERIAREANIDPSLVEETLQKLLSSQRYQQVLKQVGGSRKRLVEVFGDSIAAHQRITQGRNAAEMSADEYLQEIFESSDIFDAGTPDQIATITSKNVVVTDLVVGTLLQQLRDLGIAGREISDFADLTDIDAPADQILDTILTALTETKRARIVKSQNFRELGAGKQRYLEETLSADMKDTRESIQSILKIAGDAEKEGDGDLLMALFEAFSSMKTVNSIDDFDAWARKMIKGGEIEGKPQTGALIRELQGMMIHSILSGPKTAIRAMMGTASATFLRPISQTIGATLRLPFTGDTVTLRAGLAQLNAMVQSIPESFDLFKTRLNSYWSGDIATVKTRFAEYTRGDDNWEVLRRWVESPESGATVGDRVWFNLANMARSLNNNRFLTYSTKLMAATDDSFSYILGRAKMREKAMRSAMDAADNGSLKAYTEITPELIRVYEEDFYRQIFDGQGNIIDDATKYAKKEVTLTKELTGFAGGLNQVFQANPWAKPFFLFARTGVNGLELTAKHTPGLNFLVKEFNDIAKTTADNLEDVAKYGIKSAEELANAKALQTGRLAMGSALIFMAGQAWMRGDITGNGPIDRQKRQVWIDGGYKPRTIYLGDVGFSYDSIEPFNQIFSLVADIGDASQLMGEEWTEDNLLKVSLLLAQGITSKTYLAGMQQFVDLAAGKPGQINRIAAGLTNNIVPLAGIRNELGKIFTPYTRELSSGIQDAIRNRNLITEHIAQRELPIKYDILNGKPIKDWDPITRMWNAASPISFNLSHSPGRKLLFESGYDLRTSVYFSPAPSSLDLSDHPELRSAFQKALGDQNLELELNKLARNPKILESIEEMNRDIKMGNRALYESKDYYHNYMIGKLFDNARRIAWAKVEQENAEILQELKQEKQAKKSRRYIKGKTSAGIEPILSIYR